MAALVGAAVGLVLFAFILVTVGSCLFIGEWLFGSIGWGVLLFTELALAIALGSVLLALDVPASRLSRWAVPAAAIGVVVAVVAGLYVFNRLWEQLALTVTPTLDPATSALVVGIAVGAAIGAAVGIIGGARANAGGSAGQLIVGAIGAFLLGAVIGGLIGAFSSITFSWQVAVAMGLAAAIAAWTGLAASNTLRAGFDAEAFGQKFYPTQTIEATKETIEWVRERMPLGPRS